MTTNVQCTKCDTSFYAKRNDAKYCADCQKSNSKEYVRRYYQSTRGKSLNSKRNRIRRQELQNWLNNIKSNPCSDCKQTFPAVAMQFDHVRGTKVANIGLLLTRTPVVNVKEVVLEEIEKCDLVCANCHFIREWYRGLYQNGFSDR